MEDKELLLRDLCARLPHGQIVKMKFGVMGMPKLLGAHVGAQLSYNKAKSLDSLFYNVKCFLRPMTQMTEKEKSEYNQIEEEWRKVDYLDFHALDHRGLLEKKLAYEAKDGMYNFE